MNEHIQLNNCSLRQFTTIYSSFIKQLFSHADVRKYYVLRDDHARNLDLFIQFMLQSQNVMNFIILDRTNQPVGLISAEFLRSQATGEPYWNIGYAVIPSQRDKKYASTAVDGLYAYLKSHYSITNFVLDISEDNNASERVAIRCGFRKCATPSIDPNHMELGLRYKWEKSGGSKRIAYFNEASNAYRMRKYSDSLKLFKMALAEAYPAGTPYTDAQIYANMAMAYSSLHMYREDLQCLKKAQSLCLNNPSIEKELTWLRNNVGLY